MIKTTDFPALTAYLDSVYNEAASNTLADLVGFKVFRVGETPFETHAHTILHGLGGLSKVAQGSDFANLSLAEGDSVTWTQTHYAGLVSVTKDMRIFERTDEIENLVRSVTDSTFNQIDQVLADVLLNGFSSANYTDAYSESVAATGYDGLAFFSASHTNNLNSNVFSNIITYSTVNPVISREAIIAAQVAARKYKDPSGVRRPVNLDTILVSPDKYDDAMRIVYSDKVSGEFINDTNKVLNGSLRVMQWEKLALSSGGTDTTAYWYMFDSKKVGEALRLLFKQRPKLDAPDIPYKNKDWDYTIDTYHTVGRGYSPSVYGSNASGA